ncbi:hypothetical protein [Rhodophyticola porphyridii]|uniref:Uncharacterized protein n=1 Tax=Rhodophyticola porphyridii TaxID=1852017 RepID=A0A3L9Y4I6_9RHOB|nr:hypothetical protein [Rhodophyticola porphyridii]RMA41046.1 hypothetical protein D9R08_16295 [Rhodophyticola porphyridii]
MTRNDQIDSLLARVETAGAVDEALLEEVSAGIAAEFPMAAQIDHNGHAGTDAALHLVDTCLPGWTISLRGKATEPDGHWRCSLRETSSRDNDAFVGVGLGPTVGHALLMALLKLIRSGAHAPSV